jgi:hypothetical protein
MAPTPRTLCRRRPRQRRGARHGRAGAVVIAWVPSPRLSLTSEAGVCSQPGWAPAGRPMRASVGRGPRCSLSCGVRKRASAVADVRPRPWTKERSILSRLGGVPSLKLALWPTVPAEEAVVRRRATSATRQRTIEANGIDCGASCSRRGPGCGERPGDSVLWVLVGAGGDEPGVLSNEPGAPTTA